MNRIQISDQQINLHLEKLELEKEVESILRKQSAKNKLRSGETLCMVKDYVDQEAGLLANTIFTEYQWSMSRKFLIKNAEQAYITNTARFYLSQYQKVSEDILEKVCKVIGKPDRYNYLQSEHQRELNTIKSDLCLKFEALFDDLRTITVTKSLSISFSIFLSFLPLAK